MKTEEKADRTIIEMLDHTIKLAEDDKRFALAEIVLNARDECLRLYVARHMAETGNKGAA
ncbi:hypothetical protein [Asticcacaulis sp. 201]|uniref:hypothetical protein n=1 Tax=Asticcacaulis sp. 201 TaxID=3028787 RepID=UPI00291651D9|nr:hypothetical protein [Asticcacaulis sp. 201]MDV6329878.1 hypothetical protein [Asticcacaulis sp. 201]